MLSYRFHKSFILFVFFLSVFLSACNDQSDVAKQKQNNDETVALQQSDSGEKTPSSSASRGQHRSAFSWLKLSGWHTQGTISRDEPIRIIFNREIIESDKVGKDASKVMHISPAVTGHPVFESQTEIIWVPPEKLHSGETYKVSIKPFGLKDISSREAPYHFSFHVIPLEFEVKTLGLSPALTGNDMLLKGQLLVSDRVVPEKVNQLLTATQQGKVLPVEWSHSRNGKKHEFMIHGIKRESFATDVKLKWDGKPLNINSQGSQEVRIPALNEFKVSQIRLKHGDSINPYVEVRFSDRLDPQQNLKGLVKLAKNKYKVQRQGNIIKIYPNKNLSGTFKVTLNEGIKGEKGQVLAEPVQQNVVFDSIKPQVRFVGKGSILPENSTLEIPFEAVAANAVEVTAFEIYPDNMRQFLQVNRLSGNREPRRTGRYLWRKTIPLTAADTNKWNRYSFNVTDMMKHHKGGLLRLTLTIRQAFSSYDCPAGTQHVKDKPAPLKNLEDDGVQEVSGWDGISDYFEENAYYDYRWNDRNNPCKKAYYKYNQDKVSASQNFIASNIGLIAKQDGNGNLHVISTDIRTAEPLTGVNLEVRNYQGQLMATAQSDGSGFATLELSATPFLLTARKFDDVAYLKVNAKTALAVSHFDVGGQKIKKGIKGIIYGERGVWRPGDNIYLTFVLQNRDKSIPQGHPVTMKLFDPRGREVASKTSTASVGGFYAFTFKTEEKAETGRWMAKAYLGGSTFSKSLSIETVRPNRLKIDLGFENPQTEKAIDVLYSRDGKVKGKLFSQWLHGARASNLKADISLRFSPKKTRFGRFTDFNFDDPARRLKSTDKMLLEGRLDNEGYLVFEKAIKPSTKPAGMLKATFTSRVFEEGGAFSISSRSVDYHPYQQYVGIKLPKGDATRNMLLTDKQHTVEIASLSDKGDPVSLDEVQVKLYKIDWKWWWDKSGESLAEYADGKNTRYLQEAIISTKDGKGSWNFSIKYPEWGRYLIRACDLQGGHCTGKTVYIDWPGWAGRAQEEGSGAASRLSFFSDKSAYTVGETAIIQLPAATQGRALLTVETGSSILQQRWLEFSGGNDKDNKLKLEIPITAEMSPNAYVHISVLQPHKDKHNDRPIRLYGIIPLQVDDPETYLKPKLELAKEWKPETTQTVKVSETNGKPMNYTLAIVDEGLLGLTAFKTPDLRRYFYSKEALGIKTWDVFDEVIGAYGGKLERMIALGGGDEADIDNEDSKKRRFPPVVQFLGPFHLAAGETKTHNVTLPAYLGAVRVMLVAGESGAYGSAHESVFVRQPLMLQASLPRVLGPDEDVNVPLNLFVMNDKIKQVSVTVETDDLVSVLGDKTQTLAFDATGDKITFMHLKTANKTGKTHLKFIATSHDGGKNHQSVVDVYLDIRQANQETTRTLSKVINPGDTWENPLKPFGIEGSNHALLEISSVPALNLEKHLQYLVQYPHGCLEQTTSSVFPQLYLNNVMSLDKQRQQEIEYHVNRGIERLRRFQNGEGNFNYWPGGRDSNAWASVYAGHFLVEAKKQGYAVPADLLADWLRYQIDTAQSYVAASQQYSHVQAYRLYVLALAGKPQLGAMNRLRESSKLNNKARWMLASAYQRAAQPDAARSLLQGLQVEAETVAFPDDTFSSTLANLGIQLDSLVTLDKKQDANLLLERIAGEMGRDRYQNTQGIAWALMSVSRYLGGDTSHFSARIQQGANQQTIESQKAIASTKLGFEDAFKVENTSGIKLFATLINQGVPSAGAEQALEQGLSLAIAYETRVAGAKETDKQKEKWQALDISRPVLQGSDIRIKVSVSNHANRRVKNIALTIPVAAGMEIMRSEAPDASDHSRPGSQIDYKDVRDDRVQYYFALKQHETMTFNIVANASYQGHFYLPAINAEAMYDGKLHARQIGRWIDIVKTLPEATSATNTVADADSEMVTLPKRITITTDKAWLYDLANENFKSKMYLLKGDEAEVLDFNLANDNTRWYKVRYKGKKLIEKWIRVETTE